jgi:4-alpha-glucanotransferase
MPPAEYPPLAAAAAATHDMPTIQGFWLGRDIVWRRRLGLYPDDRAAEAETAERRRDRRLLLEALAREGLIAPECCGEFLSDSGEPLFSAALVDAVLGYLARSEARLILVQLEDVLGESEQANLPGTTEGHPNWRRRCPHSLEEVADGPWLHQTAELIAKGRSAPGR